MQPFTVAAILQMAAGECPDHAAVVGADGMRITYQQLVTGAEALARGLLGLGLEPGDRVVAWMDDSMPYIEVYAACALARLVVVPVNSRFTEHEAAQLVADADAAVLVFSLSLSERVAALLQNRPMSTTVCTDMSSIARITIAELKACAPDIVLSAPLPADLYVIGYTSGTTGRPKGAMLTQGSVATLARMNTISYRLPIGSVAALTGSMSFVAVVPSHIISHFYVRGTVHILGRWDVESLLSSIERHQVTFTYIPSPMLSEFTRAAAASPERWRSLQTVLHSASKAPAATLRALAAVIGYRLVEGWGMTENSGGLVTATVPSDLDPSHRPDLLDTVGRAVPEVRIRVLNPHGGHVPHDGQTVGELVFASPAQMVGYWRQPQATAAALRDGWYHSGDLGTIDPDGYVRISDRRVDLIVSGGMNVYPSEVEECILALDGVSSCAVVGRPHRKWGQAVVAVVVRADGSTLDTADVIDHCRTFLASYKKPTEVVFVEALPVTTSLKVSRQAVRELLE